MSLIEIIYIFFILCICVETLNLSIPVKFYSRETNSLRDMVAQSSKFLSRRHALKSEKMKIICIMKRKYNMDVLTYTIRVWQFSVTITTFRSVGYGKDICNFPFFASMLKKSMWPYTYLIFFLLFWR